MSLSCTKKTLMPSIFLLTLGGPLRIVLDSTVKGLPLLNAARETIEVRGFYYFLIIYSCKVLLLFLFKKIKFQLEELCVSNKIYC